MKLTLNGARVPEKKKTKQIYFLNKDTVLKAQNISKNNLNYFSLTADRVECGCGGEEAHVAAVGGGEVL